MMFDFELSPTIRLMLVIMADVPPKLKLVSFLNNPGMDIKYYSIISYLSVSYL